MSSFARVVLAILVIAAIPIVPLGAQADEQSIHASVVDRTGAPVTGLTATDFVVRENGVEREVLRAAPATEPLRVAVLVDTSQAIDSDVSNVRDAVRGFFRALPSNTEVALIGFGQRPTVLTDYTRDTARLNEGIGRLFAQPGSGAYLLDAIVEASRGLRVREGVRPIIVVITAEGAEFSDRYHRTVVDELRGRVALHSFVITRRGGSLRSQAARERELTLAEGARMTGGRREHVLTSMALEDRLQELAAELQNQYRIDYSRPGVLMRPNEIEIRVNRAALTVRAPRVAPGKYSGR